MTGNAYTTPAEAAAYKAGRDASPPTREELEAAAAVVLKMEKFVGRCATCRWAVSHEWGETILACDHAWTDNVECDDDYCVVVAPDFGCTEWEAKL